MVILQFNKLIRNKWVWGVFAIIVSAAFCFDDLFRPSDSDRGVTNPLKDLSVKYDGALEAECRDALRVTSNPSDHSDRTEDIYRTYAAAAAFDQAGISVANAELGQMLNVRFLSNYENMAEYKQRVQQTYGMDIARFERAWRRALQIERGYELYQDVSTWVSPMEIDQIRHDRSDVFSVRIATFNRKEMAAGPETIEEADVKAWYDANVARVRVPKTYTVKYVEFAVSNTNLLAACQATDDEVKKYYADNLEKLYTSTNATGEKVVKELKDVSATIARDLTRGKFIDTYDKLVRPEVNKANNVFVDSTDENKRQTPSILNKIAGLHGLTVKTVENVAVSPSSDLVKGLVTSASSIFTGRAEARRIANIAPTADNYRYAILKDDLSKRIWVVETVAEKDAEQVAFEACKDKIQPLALTAKQDEAFKAAVKKVMDEGVDAVLTAGKAPEAVTYSAATSNDSVLGIVSGLNKGEMSELIGDKVYVCIDRTGGDYDALAAANRQAFTAARGMRASGNQRKWLTANLKRMGYEGKDAAKPRD